MVKFLNIICRLGLAIAALLLIGLVWALPSWAVDNLRQTSQSQDQYRPAVSGNRIVWQDDYAGAQRQTSREEELFSMASVASPVNGHAATFALYEETHPDLFPTLASLYWTRGNWFFSLQVVPIFNRDTGTQPSTDFKHGIAVGIAQQLGY